MLCIQIYSFNLNWYKNKIYFKTAQVLFLSHVTCFFFFSASHVLRIILLWNKSAISAEPAFA